MLEFLGLILSSTLISTLIASLINALFLDKTKQSIKYEYAEKLESYKSELDSKVEIIKNDNQVYQLRTSLFFDHQRDAFAGILMKISAMNEEWLTKFEPNRGGLFSPISHEKVDELKKLIDKHQLFFDEECFIAIDLIMNVYERSFLGEFDNPRDTNFQERLDYIVYVQPRLASIFRNKIGVEVNPRNLREVCILSGLELLNRNRNVVMENSLNDGDVNFIRKGRNRKVSLSPPNKVIEGNKSFVDLLNTLKKLELCLENNRGGSHETLWKVRRCLKILEKTSSS